MFYKRTEYFRYAFGKPHEARFRIVLDDDTRKVSGVGECTLIDLSPRGAKLFAKYDIPFVGNEVRITMEFTLFKESIDVEGKIVWKKSYDDGYLYGFEFDAGVETEQLIIEELKLLSRAGLSEGEKEKNT